MPNFQVNQVTIDELSPELRSMISSGGGGGAPSDHNHDDRYYTETEINTKLDGKANTSHAHANYLTKEYASTMDLNELVNAGAYRVDVGNANKPTGTDYGQVLVVRGTGDTVFQIISDFNSTHLYWRSGNPTQAGGAGNWGDWKKIYHQGNKPTPAEIGALPLAGGTITGGINYSGGGYSNRALWFLNGDANGAGMFLGSGGLTVLGSGESGVAYMNNLPDGGNGTTENTVVCSDGGIIFRTGVQSGFADTKKMVFDSNGELTLTTNGLTFPATGGQWITGKTSNNVFNISGVTQTGSYYPIMRCNMPSGNVANLGTIGDNFGFWGYLASQTANGTNAGAYLDVANNKWIATGGIQAGSSSGNLKRTTISTANPSGGSGGDVWIKYV